MCALRRANRRLPADLPRAEVPTIDSYADGQTAPTPEAIDFTPGELLGCVSGELGLRTYLESFGHELVVTSDKDGADSEFERHLADAEVVISQPFWPRRSATNNLWDGAEADGGREALVLKSWHRSSSAARVEDFARDVV